MSLIVLALLAQTALPAAAATPTPVAPAAPKMRCIRVAETGSLARTSKICKPVAEWEEQRRNAQTQTRDMQDPSSGSGAGPTG